MTRILAIDGGGIRGIIPAMVLDHIERKTTRATADLFDVIAGTSTGGILALGLTCPGDSPGRPRYSARDLLELYEERGAEIFPHELLARLRQLYDEKYSAEGLENALLDTLGQARLKDALTGVFITTYDIERRRPVFFRSARARDEPEGHDFLMRDVARATSAAPTYFEPVRLRAEPPRADYALIDGGVFANNPGMCALVDAYAGESSPSDTLMVSLGTGTLTRPLPYGEAKDWGLVGWGRRIVDVVFDGVSDSVDYQLRRLLDERYHRFQTELDKARDDMDDASPANIANLKLEAEELIETNAKALEDACSTLAALAAPGSEGGGPRGGA